jgi:hypothetical protein
MKYSFEMVGHEAIYKSEQLQIEIIGNLYVIKADNEEDKQKAQRIVETVQNLMALL